MFYILLMTLLAPLLLNASEVSLQSTSSFTIQVESDDYRQLILDQLPETFVIRHLVFEVDGVYRPDDIALLTGIPTKGNATRLQLLSGLFYIQQLGLFASVRLEGQWCGQQELDLRIVLRQNIVVDRIKIAGFLRNKQLLKNLYVIDPGDVFDQSKHDHSVDHMKMIFQEQGYLQAQIHDLVLPENDSKKVVVRCTVARGDRFRIGRVTTAVECVGNLDSVDLGHLSARLSDFFAQKLQHKYYTADLMRQVEHKARLLLGQEGFIDIGIRAQPTVLYKECLVNLAMQISLEKKREFVVWGNDFFKQDQILDHLLLYGKSTWHFPGSIIVDEVEQLYKGKGFWDVHVSVKEERQRIFCFVQEGPRSCIGSVRIINNGYQGAQILAQSSFRPALKARYYDKDLLKKSTDHFIKAYKAVGYWDIKICKQEFVLGKRQGVYDYLITVNEGRRRVIGNVTIDIPDNSSYALIDDEGWKHLCRKQIGRGFDRGLLVEQQQWLVAYFKNKGYQNIVAEYELVHHEALSAGSDAELQATMEKNVDIVGVLWRIKLPETVMKFGKTIILGNSKVPYRKLLKECTYQEGDDWDKKQLEATLKNLKEIPIFDSVQIYPGREVDELGQKPVFIKLTDADRYEIKSRFGLQQVGKNLQLKRGFTYKVGGSISVNQLFSVVDKWTLYADVTRFYRDAGMTYDIPWFKESRVRSQLKWYDVLYQQPVFVGSEVSLYKAGRQGFLWNISRTYGRALLGNSFGLEFMGLYEADQPSLDTIIRYDKDLLGQKTGYLFLEPTVMWRHVDSELNPRSGFASFVSCRGMFDMNHKSSFCKILAEHTQYVPVNNAVTAAVRLRAGHVFNRDFTQIHPTERFYLGGASSIRGYDRDYCPPFGLLTKPIKDAHAGLPLQANDVWRYAPQGGRTMFNLNAELRCDIYKNFGVVLFTDCGALLQDSIQDDLHDSPRKTFAGSGIGIRYDTPIGPLRIDLGFKWHIQNHDFESRHVWSISLGQAF